MLRRRFYANSDNIQLVMADQFRFLRSQKYNAMLSVKAIYDGKNLKLLKPVDVQTPQEVIITFLQDSPDTSIPNSDVRGADIQRLVGGSQAFAFLADDEEDIYTDADLKVKY